MIAVVDYEAGNLRSVTKALESCGVPVAVTGDPEVVASADKIVLPGVGAFGKAVSSLRKKGLIEPLILSIRKGKPFLGICLGLQMLFEASDESPGVSGLGVIPGKVVRFQPGLKVPHLGWNEVVQSQASPLWKGVPDPSFFYFAHSFCALPSDAGMTIGTTEYGSVFASALQKDLLFGIQFHPEKSQKNGLKILENFVKL
jgi:imidazole glycerol-phosphate synthase subunit HisH